MRNLRFYALGLILIGGLAASQANAISQVNHVYTGGSTAAAGTGGSEIEASMGDTLSFDVSVDVDAAGLAGLFFDLIWSAPALNNTAANWASGSAVTSFAPFTSVTLTTPIAGATDFANIGWLGLTPAVSTSIFLGTVTFAVTDAGTVDTGFFATDGSAAVNSLGTFVTPSFATFSITTTPSPGAALSLLAGLATLAGFSLRRNRRD